MADATQDLLKLRPVVFTYQHDPAGRIQYGLIAEEVAEVYPELVVHAADGEIETVRYHLLSSMLLNEWQKQHHTIGRLEAALQAKEAQIADLDARLAALEAAERGQVTWWPLLFGGVVLAGLAVSRRTGGQP